MKADPRCRQLPVVILTTSMDMAQVLKCYELGVNSFIQKPAKFQDLVELLNTLLQYWFEVVKLPKRDGRA